MRRYAIMGGRGSASGMSDKGYRYGTEYKALIRVDNIKFVQPQKPGSTPVPLETMSAGKNRVYAVINNKGILTSIVFYDKKGKRRRQIDLRHSHKGYIPHVHSGYNHSFGSGTLTKSDRAYIGKVERIWRQEHER
jgi:hypothetical protein